MRRRSLIHLSLIIPLAGAGRPLRGLASFSVLADMLRQVAGGEIGVDTLVSIGGNVHEHESRPSDLNKIARADLIIVNGLGLDRWIDRLIAASGFNAPVITAGAAVTPRRLPGGITDPHAWHNPENGVLYVKQIEAGLLSLQGLDPAVIRRHATAYIAEIENTDRWCAAQFAAIPPARRTIVTSHDAFGYFAAQYGLTIVPVRGIEDSEPSASEFASLVTRLKQHRGSVVFLENMTNPSLLTSLSQETGARIGGTLYADSLSAESGPAPTYLDMVRYNTTTIVNALR